MSCCFGGSKQKQPNPYGEDVVINKKCAPGWVGGFREKLEEDDNPDAYDPKYEIADNMENIDRLQRQQKVIWPEFSWLTVLGDDSSRCFQMFAPDISRLGYTDDGRTFSIICPQQGANLKHLGCLNVEVTVTGQKGWVKEPEKEFWSEMGVVGTIWFSPSAMENALVKELHMHFSKRDKKFPFSKEHAIKVKTSCMGDSDNPNFTVSQGVSPRFKAPKFATHYDQCWNVGHLEVQIGDIEKCGDPMVDEFNEVIMDIFNVAVGNMLKQDNVLTWNVWFDAPSQVDVAEWRNHAEKWRKSIQADYGSPTGPGSEKKYFDSTPFKPIYAVETEEIDKIKAFMAKHF